jgi:indolepyruvate ferredoxin oxidoreductase, alpha subunit
MFSDPCVMTGDQAFACAAIDAGVRLATGYPGSPSAGTFEALLKMPEARHLHLSWAINECIACEIAFGASIAGQRALLCVKSVGMNIALDPLMTMVLTGCNAGFVILLGDDPGGWASQNEQDTRILAALADTPLIEPSEPQDAYDALLAAFRWSEQHHMPFIVRETRALALSEGPVARRDPAPAVPPVYRREPERWISLPANVVRNHRRLHDKLDAVEAAFENCLCNRTEGRGSVGLVACGATYAKLREALGNDALSRFRVLKLSTFHPLPRDIIKRFLSEVETALVFEENEPYVEERLGRLAHMTGRSTSILGRETGHLPYGGELDASAIFAAIRALDVDGRYGFLPGVSAMPEGQARSMPSQKPLCSDCPYLPLFETLLEVIESAGGRDHAIIVGEPGCMVRAQLPPLELLDVKYSLGSSLGLAVGLAAAHPAQKVIAFTGDSSFLHHGWGGLTEAVRQRSNLLAIVLDNATTALTGGQPHAGTPYDVRGEAQPALDLERLAHALGAETARAIDPFDRGTLGAALHAALRFDGLNVIIARHPCPRLKCPPIAVH